MLSSMKAQTLFIEPAVQLKVQLIKKNTVWNNNEGFHQNNFSYEPIKIYNEELPIPDFGLHLGYRFKNNICLSIGYLSETAKLGARILYATYDSTLINKSHQIYNLGLIGMFVLRKYPINLGIPLGETKFKKGKFTIKHYLNTSVSFIFSRNTITDYYVTDKVRLLDGKYLSANADYTAGFYKNSLLLSLSYSTELKYKHKSICEFKLFLERGFRTYITQYTTIIVWDSNSSNKFQALNQARGSGYGFQLTKKFNFQTKKMKKIKEIEAENEKVENSGIKNK